MPSRHGQQHTHDPQVGTPAHTPAPPQTAAPVQQSASPAALIQRARLDPRSLSRAELLHLHRTLGNRAVGQWLRGGPPTPPVGPGTRPDGPERPDPTGVPEALKAGIEALSGVSLDDVTVHYHAPEPVERQALAYTQGRDIYVAPGQERHLPHEAWHVVQQAQGRVRPTGQWQDGVSVNEDAALEREADAMGARAAGGAAPHAGGRGPDAAPTASGPSVVQLAELPEDSTGSLGKIFIKEDSGEITDQQGPGTITAQALQTRLITALSAVGEKGFGYRLVSFRYDGQDFQQDTRTSHHEPHGMQAWPEETAPIKHYLADIKRLVRATLADAKQLQYLDKNFEAINKEHDIIVDVDWYRARTQSEVGFHKDSRGTTLFVNLTYDNPREMYGASTKPDLTRQKALEEKLPAEVQKDLAKRRESYGTPEPGHITEARVGPYARVSFSDPSIWHSTPLLGHRAERAPLPRDEPTLEAYLFRTGYPVYAYRGILNYYPVGTAEQCEEALWKVIKAEALADSQEALVKALRTLGAKDEDLDGYADKETPAEFWLALSEEDRDQVIVPPPSDEATLEAYLVDIGRPVHCYRGILNYYPVGTAEQCQEALWWVVKEEGLANSQEALAETLRELSRWDPNGYANGYTTEAFWLNGIKKMAGNTLTDKYSRHGISNEIKLEPKKAKELDEQVKGRKRALSMLLDETPGLQETLNREAKRPRTFIRTWVRMVPRPAATAQ